MIFFFTGGGLFFVIAIGVLLILSGIGIVETTIQNIIQNYGFWIILVLTGIAMIVWTILTSNIGSSLKKSNKLKAKNSLYRCLIILSSSISSALAVFNCLLIIYLPFKIFMDGLDKDGLLIVFTAIVYIFKGIFWLLLGFVIGGLGVGLPAFAVMKDEKEKAKKCFEGSQVAMTIVGGILQIAAFIFIYLKII